MTDKGSTLVAPHQPSPAAMKACAGDLQWHGARHCGRTTDPASGKMRETIPRAVGCALHGDIPALFHHDCGPGGSEQHRSPGPATDPAATDLDIDLPIAQPPVALPDSRPADGLHRHRDICPGPAADNHQHRATLP